MALKIDSKINGSIVTLELVGDLSTLETKEFDTTFANTVKGMKEALLDFSQVDYISSAGLRSLFLAKKLMIKQGGEFKILYPSKEVMEVFKATRYDNIVTIIQHKEETTKPIFYPLRPVQRMMVDTHFQKAESTIMNIGALGELDNSIDLDHLAEAINDLLNSYDIFRIRLAFNPETGDICQRFDGEIKKVYVESLSDEDFEKRKQELQKPFKLIDHSLYRIYIIKTPKINYLYMDFYHAIMDGVAVIILFWRELNKRYVKGIDTQNKIPNNDYSAYILEEANLTDEQLAEGRAYWKNILAAFDKNKHLPPMDGGDPSDGLEHELETPITNIEKSFFKNKSFNENTFLMAATMLTIANLNGADDSVMTWVHNGRITPAERRLMGLMLDQFPISWDFSKDISVSEFLIGLEAKIAEGLKYRKSLDVVYDEGLEDKCACFILQKGAIGRRGAMKLGDTSVIFEELPTNEINVAENIIDIEFNAHDDGTFALVLNYDIKYYSRNSMKRFTQKVIDIIEALKIDTHMISELLNKR